MIIDGLQITFMIFDSYSLKDKRRVIKGMMERIRNRFNVSISEIEDHEIWNKCVVGVACVSNSEKLCNQMFDQVIHFIDENTYVEITKVERY